MIILSQEDIITKENLPKEVLFGNIKNKEFILPESGIDLEMFEKSFIKQALIMTNNNKTKASKLLGITRHTLLFII